MCAPFPPRAPPALSCKQQFTGEVDLGACVAGVQSLLLSKTPQASFGGGGSGESSLIHPMHLTVLEPGPREK